MTLQELSQYFKLREQLARDEEILESLRATACPGAQVLTGMPHATGVRDKVGDLAVEIADMKERIRYLREEIGQEESRVTAFISGIENDQTRMIFRLRFLRCLTWGEVAAVVGGRNTESSVKNTCYRYLESCDGVVRGGACCVD
ncbi:MAG: hypothetical protein ACLSAF_22430 [Intestinimonas sp.]